MLAALRGLGRRLDEPVDGASLGAFRVGLGLVLAAAFARVVLRGWVQTLYVEPTFFFTYPGFSWVRPVAAPFLYVTFAMLFVAALLLATGRAYRIAAGTLFVLFTYVELLDRTTYLNHYYLTSLLLLLACVLPLDRALVLGKQTDETIPRAALYVLRAQIGLVYVFAGIAKLRPDWLLRGEPLHLWLSMYDDTPLIGPWLAHRSLAIAMSWAGAVFDLAIPLLLSSRRTRVPAYFALIVFHVLTGLLFPLGMFPFVMTLAATVFFPPSWPRAFMRGLSARMPRPAPALPRAIVALLALHLVVQLLVPLRRLAYPGDTCFTEDGFRFAWQVMLLEKRGLVTFTVTDARGRRRFVDPKRALRAHQYRQMSTQPDLVLAYAHHLADEAKQRGEGRVAVHADAWVTWNGRPSQRFIDPDIDLARVPDDLESASRYTTEPTHPQRW